MSFSITFPCPDCCGEGNCLTNASYDLTFLGRTGSGCLIGYSEYTSPSDPPKKYRRKTNSGFATSVYFPDSSCSGSPASTLTCTYNGWCQYNKVTGVLTTGGDTVCGGVVIGTGCGDPGAGCDTTVSYTKTVASRHAIPGACCPESGTYHRETSDTLKATLSDEDTIDDALARGTSVEGPNTSAILDSFDTGTFCFVGKTSHWTANFDGLNPNCNYRFVVHYQRDDGLGGTEEITEETTFSPEEQTYTIEGDIPAVVDRETFFVSSELQVVII